MELRHSPRSPTRPGPAGIFALSPGAKSVSLPVIMRIALYEPDIPQNTGTILRLAACLGVEAHIIEPAGFPISDRAFRRAGMDYLDQVAIVRHAGWEAFEDWRAADGGRLVLFTTRAATSYLEHAYRADDVLLFGRESAGVPEQVHRPRRLGWSSRCGPACARSTWRWRRRWRSAKRCGRQTDFRPWLRRGPPEPGVAAQKLAIMCGGLERELLSQTTLATLYFQCPF